jgi:hypothetical protein
MRLNFPKELNFYISMRRNIIKKILSRRILTGGLFLYHFSALTEAQFAAGMRKGIRGRKGFGGTETSRL